MPPDISSTIPTLKKVSNTEEVSTLNMVNNTEEVSTLNTLNNTEVQNSGGEYEILDAVGDVPPRKRRRVITERRRQINRKCAQDRRDRQKANDTALKISYSELSKTRKIIGLNIYMVQEQLDKLNKQNEEMTSCIVRKGSSLKKLSDFYEKLNTEISGVTESTKSLSVGTTSKEVSFVVSSLTEFLRNHKHFRPNHLVPMVAPPQTNINVPQVPVSALMPTKTLTSQVSTFPGQQTPNMSLHSQCQPTAYQIPCHPKLPATWSKTYKFNSEGIASKTIPKTVLRT